MGSVRNGAQLSGGALETKLLPTVAQLERDGAKAARDVSKASGRFNAELVRNTAQISENASPTEPVSELKEEMLQQHLQELLKNWFAADVINTEAENREESV